MLDSVTDDCVWLLTKLAESENAKLRGDPVLGEWMARVLGSLQEGGISILHYLPPGVDQKASGNNR